MIILKIKFKIASKWYLQRLNLRHQLTQKRRLMTILLLAFHSIQTLSATLKTRWLWGSHRQLSFRNLHPKIHKIWLKMIHKKLRCHSSCVMFIPRMIYFSHSKSKVSTNFLTNFFVGQIFLPAKRYITMSFLRALLSGSKSFFTNSEVHPINIPRYKEFSLSNVISYMNVRPALKKFLPDGLGPDEPLIDRKFVFSVLNTCEPSYFPIQL